VRPGQAIGSRKKRRSRKNANGEKASGATEKKGAIKVGEIRISATRHFSSKGRLLKKRGGGITGSDYLAGGGVGLYVSEKTGTCLQVRRTLSRGDHEIADREKSREVLSDLLTEGGEKRGTDIRCRESGRVEGKAWGPL